MAGEPYAEAAWLYRRAGWAGVLPLPAGAKWPPPRGYTGWAGLDPSGADVQAWCEGREGAGNVALRLPHGVYGLDVDAYDAKDGAGALAELIERLGPLPATWIVTSRDDHTSGIRLFRAELSPGWRWRDEPAGTGRGIEAIHFGHRYAVVWPSVHPEGRKYAWWRPDGTLAGDYELPRVDELPALPLAWYEGLAELGEVRTGGQAGHGETLDAVNAWRTGEPCPIVERATAVALHDLHAAADGAALHPTARDRTHELACLGHEGHVGAREALAAHYSVFVEVRAARGAGRGVAEAEWWRLVRGAVGKLVGERRAECDCAVWSGAGVQFDWTPPTPTGIGQSGHELSDARTDAHARAHDDDARAAEPGDLADALIARMLTADQLARLPPPEPLVDGLLTRDSAAWLIALPGSYKSFVALDWAGHIGAGRAWLGREVAHGPVVYVVAEGVAGMGPRVRAWQQRNGPMTGVHFLPLPVQAARDEQWSALVEACRRLGPVFVILDTQARVTVGLDENDNAQMGQYVEAVERVRRATRACVLTVHHLGRNGQHARGASAIDGAQDTELRLTKTGDRRAVIEIDKSKNTRDDVRVEVELFVAELDGGGDSLVVGAPLTSAAPAPEWRADLTLNQAALVDIMTGIFPEVGATKSEMKSEARKRPVIALDGSARPPMSESSFRRAWDSLVSSSRFVRVAGSQRHVFVPGSPDSAVSE